jgi:hypothetical protein
VSGTADPLTIARAAMMRLRTGSSVGRTDCEVSEECEGSRPADVPRAEGADRFVQWRVSNAKRLAVSGYAVGRDPGGTAANIAVRSRTPSSNEVPARGACRSIRTGSPNTG